jgi:hypothetical protein
MGFAIATIPIEGGFALSKASQIATESNGAIKGLGALSKGIKEVEKMKVDKLSSIINSTLGKVIEPMSKVKVYLKNSFGEFFNFKSVALPEGFSINISKIDDVSDSSKVVNKIGQVSEDVGNYGKVTEEISKVGKNITDIINSNGLTLDKFNELRIKDTDLLTDVEKTIMKSIRDSISIPDNMTTMQKVIPYNDIGKYLEGSYTQVGGYVTKHDDVLQLIKYEDIYESLRLDYPGTAYKVDLDNSLGVIRFKTPDAAKFEIPYGVDFGGTITDAPPFTGNGFTKAMNGNIIPEYKCNSFLDIYDGAELYQIDKSGIETLIAVFSEIEGKFMPIK